MDFFYFSTQQKMHLRTQHPTPLASLKRHLVYKFINFQLRGIEVIMINKSWIQDFPLHNNWRIYSWLIILKNDGSISIQYNSPIFLGGDHNLLGDNGNFIMIFSEEQRAMGHTHPFFSSKEISDFFRPLVDINWTYMRQNHIYSYPVISA